ncbi:MAG: hypothetical protein ACE5EK_04195 [Nitrospinales bacterium]
MFNRKDNQIAVKCQVTMAKNCVLIGEYVDSEEEALEWVEEDCWISSGEGWICPRCHEQILKNIGNIGKPPGMV